MANRKNEFQSRRAKEVKNAPLTAPVEEDVIDLREIWKGVLRHVWMLVVLTLAGGALAGLLTKFLIAPTYESSGTIFLTPKVSNGTVDYTSLNTNQKLVNNCINLITQDNIMSTVSQEVGLESASAVRNTLTVTNTSDTEIITVTATTKDAKLSKDIVDATLDVFISTMQENLNVSNIEIVNSPKLSYVPAGPNVLKNSVLGAICGLGIGLLIVVVEVLTDKRLKTRDEAESFLGYPVYCELPNMDKKRKGK